MRVFVIRLFLVLACIYTGGGAGPSFGSYSCPALSAFFASSEFAGHWLIREEARMLLQGSSRDAASSGTPFAVILFSLSPRLSGGCPEVLQTKVFSVVIVCERVWHYLSATHGCLYIAHNVISRSKRTDSHTHISKWFATDGNIALLGNYFLACSAVVWMSVL